MAEEGGVITRGGQDIIMELDARAMRGNYGMPAVIHVLVVGCGGNGGHVIPQIMRYNRALLSRLGERPRAGQRRRAGSGTQIELTLVDADVVEQRNLMRQNFIAPDIGRNKASVLAERYGRAFGLEVGAVESYLDVDKAHELLSRTSGESVIVLGCVDNNYTRKALHDAILNSGDAGRGYFNVQHLFWIDVANERFDGQLAMGYRSYHMINRGYNTVRERINQADYWQEISETAHELSNGLPTVRRGMHFPMPFITEIFPTILEEAGDFDPNDPSCAENAEQVDQAMSTNILSASIMFSAYCQAMSVLIDQGDDVSNEERRPRANLIHFGHGGRFSTTFNTPNNLGKIYVDEELVLYAPQ